MRKNIAFCISIKAYLRNFSHLAYFARGKEFDGMIFSKRGLIMKGCIAIIAAFALAAVPIQASAEQDSAVGWGSSRISACSQAKQNARNMVPYPYVIVSFSSCDCEQTADEDRWECSVDYIYRRNSSEEGE